MTAKKGSRNTGTGAFSPRVVKVGGLEMKQSSSGRASRNFALPVSKTLNKLEQKHNDVASE